MRVSLGFEPDWFHRRCSVDFGERWHKDPIYRHRTLVAMKAELRRAFPEAVCWDFDSTSDTWTLSGCHGAYVIPWVLGCTLAYPPDRWPVITEKPRRSLAEWSSLCVGDLLHGPAVEDLNRQMDIIEAEAGLIHGYLNWQGVLNNAFHVYGQNLFFAMVDEPDEVQRFLELITELMIRLVGAVQARQRASGFDIDQLDVSNCVMNMLSPRMYRQFVLLHDTRIARSFARFGIHTCNWDVTPYIGVLRELPNLGYLDMGIMSDLRRVRDAFPETRRAVLYSPVQLEHNSLDQIRSEMRKVYCELAPCDVVMADIQASTPDERVRAFLSICSELESSCP